MAYAAHGASLELIGIWCLDASTCLGLETLDLGVDPGAQTIAVHLRLRHGQAPVPSVATIWRIGRELPRISAPRPRHRLHLVRSDTHEMPKLMGGGKALAGGKVDC